MKQQIGSGQGLRDCCPHGGTKGTEDKLCNVARQGHHMEKLELGSRSPDPPTVTAGPLLSPALKHLQAPCTSLNRCSDTLGNTILK